MDLVETVKNCVTTDAAAKILLTSKSALAMQRSRRRGCRYLKIGGRVYYLEEDLKKYLDSCYIDPANNNDRRE